MMIARRANHRAAQLRSYSRSPAAPGDSSLWEPGCAGRFIATIALTALLTGCAAAPPAPLRVEIPVAIPCPAPQPLPRPALPIADLAPDAADADVLRAVVASLEALTGYAQALERQMAGYAAAP
jgi:hypothetical protein